jgi:hypothetical protein
LFIASLGAITMGGTYLWAWLENWRRFSIEEVARPWLFAALCFPVTLLLMGVQGMLWAIAMPKWIASRPCRILAHIVLYLWLITAAAIAAAFVVIELYPSTYR